jgi:hypothetical protein
MTGSGLFRQLMNNIQANDQPLRLECEILENSRKGRTNQAMYGLSLECEMIVNPWGHI